MTYGKMILAATLLSISWNAYCNNTKEPFVRMAIVNIYRWDSRQDFSFTTHDNGKTWKPSAGSPNSRDSLIAFSKISCGVESQHCVSVGSAYDGNNWEPRIYTTENGGEIWKQSNVKRPDANTSVSLYSLACDASGTTCVAVGEKYNHPDNDQNAESTPISYTTIDGGDHWRFNSSLPKHKNAEEVRIEDILCDAAAKNCLAIGSDKLTDRNSIAVAYRTNDSGANWTMTSIPKASPDLNNLYSLSCNKNMQHCVAVGYALLMDQLQFVPRAYTSDNAGESWQQAKTNIIPGKVQQFLHDVACDTTGVKCTAVGTTSDDKGLQVIPMSMNSVDGGKSWNPVVQMPVKNGSEDIELMGLFCDSNAENCLVLGAHQGSGDVVAEALTYSSNNGGNSWKAIKGAFPLRDRPFMLQISAA